MALTLSDEILAEAFSQAMAEEIVASAGPPHDWTAMGTAAMTNALDARDAAVAAIPADPPAMDPTTGLPQMLYQPQGESLQNPIWIDDGVSTATDLEAWILAEHNTGTPGTQIAIYHTPGDPDWSDKTDWTGFWPISSVETIGDYKKLIGAR